MLFPPWPFGPDPPEAGATIFFPRRATRMRPKQFPIVSRNYRVTGAARCSPFGGPKSLLGPGVSFWRGGARSETKGRQGPNIPRREFNFPPRIAMRKGPLP